MTEAAKQNWHGIPRQEIKWFPTVDAEACIGCGLCHVTCGRCVYVGLPTYEDKVLQRAVAMVLTAVYEQDFLDCSYGFRPGRGCHDALGAL